MENLPRDIRVGMKVYDRNRHHIGKVDDFKFGESADFGNVEPAELDGTDRNRDRSFIDNIADAFGADRIPDALQARLLSEGYVRIDADGFLAADRYVLPEQIASASGDELTLSVTKDELLKR